VNDLALQVGQVDVVVIAEREPPDAGRSEVERDRRAEPACADDEGMCGEQPLLAFDADLGQQDVAAVAQQLLVAEVDVGFQLSALRFQLSALSFPLSASSHRESAMEQVVSMQDARNTSGRLRAGPIADS
jgi:hypothetical protein